MFFDEFFSKLIMSNLFGGKFFIGYLLSVVEFPQIFFVLQIIIQIK